MDSTYTKIIIDLDVECFNGMGIYVDPNFNN